MGFSPIEVDQMSYWQLLSAAAGWTEAHKPDDGKLTNGEADEIWDWMQSLPPMPLTLNGHGN
jgi:hypothetical protein